MILLSVIQDHHELIFLLRLAKVFRLRKEIKVNDELHSSQTLFSTNLTAAAAIHSVAKCRTHTERYQHKDGENLVQEIYWC